MIMLDLKTLFQNILTTIGGATAATIIILRFAKKRIETFIDDLVKYKLDKRMECFKQELNKQYCWFEIYSKKYNDSIGRLLEQLNSENENINKMQECIKKCKEENKTLHFFFGIRDNANLRINLGNTNNKINQSEMEYSIYLSECIDNALKSATKAVTDYTNAFDDKRNTLDLSQEELQNLLDLGNNALNKIHAILLAIKKEKQDQLNN